MSELNEIIETWKESILKSRRKEEPKTIQSLESRMSQIDRLLEKVRKELKRQQKQIVNNDLEKQEELSLLNYSNEGFVDSQLVSGYDLVELVMEATKLAYEKEQARIEEEQNEFFGI